MTTNLEHYLEMPDAETKAELLERMAVTYDAVESLIAAHDEADLTRPLSESGWSAKDYLAHLSVWEGSLVSLLQKKDRFKEMGLAQDQINPGDIDAENDVLYELHKNRPLNDVIQTLRSTHQQLLTLLADLNDEDLQKPYSHYQPQNPGSRGDNPIMGWMAGDTYSHYAEHIIDINRLLQSGR